MSDLFPSDEIHFEDGVDVFKTTASGRNSPRRGVRKRKKAPKAKVALKSVAPRAEEKLREHPVFALDPFDSGEIGSISGEELHESERGAIYERELLRMFKGRIHLVAGIGLCFVPLFTTFFFLLAPETSALVALVEFCLFTLLGTFFYFIKYARSLPFVRLASQIGFTLFSIGNVALIMVVSEDVGTYGEVSRAVQFVILTSFVHILLAILILPFTLSEAARITLISLGLMITGLYISVHHDLSSTYIAQLFVMGTTAALILMLSHLNARLRRRLFDSAFDLALQATQLQEMSQTDTLTGSYNRRHLERILTAELARAARFRHEITVLMFDLDNFKPVNDTLGHGAGDEVLQIVARSVANVMREVDSFGRFGGDEFVVILPETGRAAALTMANRVRAHVAAQLWRECGANSLASRVTLSMGVATFGELPLPDAGRALHCVDILLYEAKRQGKDCVVVG